MIRHTFAVICLVGVLGCGGTGAHLHLDTDEVTPKGKISVHFVALDSFAENAWIGIIPSSVPHGSESTNDGHDISFQYISGRTEGTMMFTAPAAPGSYDFRMHDTDSDGTEVTAVTFTVRWPEGSGENASLSLDRTDFAPNDEIQVHFTAEREFASNGWVGIVPSSVPHGSESENDRHDLAYEYLSGRFGGTMTFTAPSEPGSYDFRMHDTDNEGREVASVSFRVLAQGSSVWQSPAIEPTAAPHATGEAQIARNDVNEVFVLNTGFFSETRFGNPKRANVQFQIPADEMSNPRRIEFTLDATRAGDHLVDNTTTWFRYVADGGQIFEPTRPCTIVVTRPFTGGPESVFRGEIPPCPVHSAGIDYTISASFEMRGEPAE